MLASTSELEKILNSWGLKPEYASLRSSWHNIFKVNQNNENLFLRLTPNVREPTEILAELEWMESLDQSGVPVAKIFHHPSGAALQTLDLQSGKFSICCFREAPGRITQKRIDFCEPVIKNWAKLLSQLHEHATNFKPLTSARRKIWHEDSVLKIALSEAQDSQEPEAKDFLQLVNHFKSLSQNSNLLLTHADLHFGNMSITEENYELYAFDFDDACYHFPDHDVSVALVSIRKAAWEYPGLFDLQKIERCFMENYDRPTSDLNLWCAYRIGMSYFWALGSAKSGVFDEERITWLRNSTPWWKAQFRECLDVNELKFNCAP